jgi:hypothetical protein
MGYIPTSTTQTLYAYLTQEGRFNLLFKDAVDFQVKYFSLHDNDVNYIIASEIINSQFNKLPKGFVPDITGDNDDCIRSVAQAHIVDANSIINPGLNGAVFVRPVFVGFTQSRNTPFAANPATNSFTGSINLELTPPTNGTEITDEELTNTSFSVYVINKQGPIKNILINGKANQSEVLTFDGSLLKNINFSFEKDNSIATNQNQTIESNILLGIKDLKYATLKGGAQSYTYSLSLTIIGITGGATTTTPETGGG